MPSILVTPPATEPVSLADAKAFPRVEHNDDDALIAALIAGARLRIEAQTRRALITHVSRLSRDIWTASSVLPILPAPLRQVLALRVFTLGGAQSVDAENLAIETMSAPARLTLCAARCRQEVDVEAGCGDAPDDVPQPLRQTIRLLTAHWYDAHRSQQAERWRAYRAPSPI